MTKEVNQILQMFYSSLYVTKNQYNILDKKLSSVIRLSYNNSKKGQHNRIYLIILSRINIYYIM